MNGGESIWGSHTELCAGAGVESAADITVGVEVEVAGALAIRTYTNLGLADKCDASGFLLNGYP